MCVCVVSGIVYIYICNTICNIYIYIYVYVPVVPHKAVVWNRKPIGEIGCCESGMAEGIHWWTERCLRSPLFLSLSLTTYLPTYLLCIYLSICLSVHLSIYQSIYPSIYRSICRSIYRSINLICFIHVICLSICLSIYLSISLCIYLNHLSKPEDLILQNANSLRQWAPWPPNISDEHVFCTAPTTRNASLKILFKCPTPAIVSKNAVCNCSCSVM